MRFKKKIALRAGDTRIVRRFLFFPKRLLIEGDPNNRKIYQTRWLEFALIFQRVSNDLIACWEDGRWVEL